MKKLIVFAAAAMMATPAMASKARIEALGNSRQLTDVQYVFDRPYMIHSVGEMVTMEWGDKGAATPKAEAGIFKNMFGGAFGLYLGRTGYLTDSVTGTLLGEQNPINILYGQKTGDISWGLNLGYSNGKQDTGDRKVSSTDLAVGATNGTWEVEVGFQLSGKSEETGNEVKVKDNTRLGFGYNIDETQHAYVTTSSKKLDGADGSTATEVGYIRTVAKTEEANFFYGVAYAMSEDKDADSKSSGLPVWMGVEAAATSWMTMRASVKQTVLINETETAGNKSSLDNIAFAAGAGIKLGKGMLDMTFGTAQNGHISFSNGAADEFFSDVSYTYMF
ncbi:MAG: hypothetical protein ACLGGX_06025 [Bdellovibrionia bacterium]